MILIFSNCMCHAAFCQPKWVHRRVLLVCVCVYKKVSPYQANQLYQNLIQIDVTGRTPIL